MDLTPNNNISFPIGTILTVQDFYNHLKLFETFGKHKSKGISLNSLIQALLSYKLTENQSIVQAAEWINRDHRPDKKQINVGIAELRDPINIPIGITIKEGNVPDQVHFLDTFNQVKDRLEEDSLAVFDQGANRKKNLDHVKSSKMKYLTIKQLNKSDDEKRIKGFDKSKAELIDEEKQVYGIKYKWPSKFNYFYFSEDLKKNQIESKIRKALRQYEEAKAIQKSIDDNKCLPKRFTINNPMIDCVYSYQTKLTSMSEEEAKDILKKAAITGREGFFLLSFE